MTPLIPTDGSTKTRVRIEAATSSAKGRLRVPLTMPSSQVYFWTTSWQRAEAESLADYEAGDYIESDDADEIIRWLDAPDDPAE